MPENNGARKFSGSRRTTAKGNGSSKHMKNKKATLWGTVIAVLVIAAALWVLGRGGFSGGAGKVTVRVTELSGKVLTEKTLRFAEGDSLAKLVQENFSGVVMDNGMLMSIESLTTPADWSRFIGIYQNGEMAAYGLEQLPFKDGDIIELRESEMTW